MTNTKSTKRALLTGILAMVLCCSMLLGTTYAWFTDSVTSANNIIVAGNLDVELYHSDKAATGEKVDSTTALFDDIALWEPGAVVYENLTVANKGDLALKYQLAVNITNAEGSKNLADVLKVAVVDGGVNTDDRDALIASIPADDWQDFASFVEAGELYPDNATAGDDTKTYGVVIWWEPSDKDNDFNMNNDNGDALKITIGVVLTATQLSAEIDSFGKDYDDLATTPDGVYVVKTSNVSKQATTAGEEVVIENENKTFAVTAKAANATEPVTATIEPAGATDAAFEAATTAGKSLVSYNVEVTGHEAGTPVTFSFYVGVGLQDVEVYHKGVKMTTGASYDMTTGYVTVTTTDFSPFEVLYTYDSEVVAMRQNAKGEWEISSPGQLLFFAKAVNAGNGYEGETVVLTSDIDMTGLDWSVNIGDDCNATFDGTFDGQGHTIKNLTSKETAQKGDGYVCTGLFGAIYGSAVIKNLTIDNANVEASFEGNNAGIVVGFAYSCTGSIENVHVINSVLNAPAVTGTGAIVGYEYYGGLTIKNCSVKNTDVTGQSYVGGVIGYASSGCKPIDNTVDGAKITANAAAAGGIAGILLGGGTIADSTVKNVTVASKHKNWLSAAGVVIGCITPKTVTVSGTVYENVNVASIVGALHADKPTTPVASVEACIGDVYYLTLKDAMAAAKSGDVIGLDADIVGDITIVQAPDMAVVIDGNGFTFNGVMTVDGKSARYETASLTIKNVNFDANGISADACVRLGYIDAARYTNNVTIKDCTFTGAACEKVAIKSYTGGDWNLTVDGCTADSGMHSLLQVANVEKGLKVIGCKVYSKNGINLNNTVALEMSGCTFDVTGYAVRFGVADTVLNGTFAIENSTLTSDCDDNDAVITCRGDMSGSTVTLVNTELVGTIQTSGNAKIVK